MAKCATMVSLVAFLSDGYSLSVTHTANDGQRGRPFVDALHVLSDSQHPTVRALDVIVLVTRQQDSST